MTIVIPIFTVKCECIVYCEWQKTDRFVCSTIKSYAKLKAIHYYKSISNSFQSPQKTLWSWSKLQSICIRDYHYDSPMSRLSNLKHTSPNELSVLPGLVSHKTFHHKNLHSPLIAISVPPPLLRIHWYTNK